MIPTWHFRYCPNCGYAIRATVGWVCCFGVETAMFADQAVAESAWLLGGLHALLALAAKTLGVERTAYYPGFMGYFGRVPER